MDDLSNQKDLGLEYSSRELQRPCSPFNSAVRSQPGSDVIDADV